MMSRTRIIATLFLMCITVMGIQAQHMDLMNQYMFNGLVLNPAYAGSRNAISASMHARNQWMGFDGAPSSYTLSGHAPIKKSDIAVGGILDRRAVGVSNDLRFVANASYKLKLDKADLRFGLGMGLDRRSARWSSVVTTEIGDSEFAGDVQGAIRPVFSAGAYYSSDKFYAGYSIPSMLTYDGNPLNGGETSISFSMGSVTHLLTAGYAHRIKRGVVIKPSTLVRVVPNGSINVDLNTNLILDDRLWLGLSYRTMNTAVALIEYQVHHQFRVGYSYDYSIGQVGQYMGGSHELMLMWEMKKRSFARSPRYF